MKFIGICKECGKETHEDAKFCDRCLAQWYLENEIPDDVPSADFDEPRREEF